MQIKLKVFTLSLVLLFTAGQSEAGEIEALNFSGNAEIGRAWKPIFKDGTTQVVEAATKPPVLSMTGDQVKAAHFELPFSKLKGWRFAWDRKIKLDLSQAEQVILRIRTDDPGAVGQAIIYMKSGEGWFSFPPFALTKDWQEQVLSISKTQKEGQPKGWHAISRIRLAFMPGAKRDASADLAWIQSRAGWPLDYMGSMGPYKSYRQIRAAIAAGAKVHPGFADIRQRIKKADALYKELRAAGKKIRKPAMQRKILQAREQVAQAWALVQKPKKEFRGVWIHHGNGVRSKGDARVMRWKEAIPLMRSYGINAVFPNVLWSGTSYYPSKVVKAHPDVAKEGDFLQEIIDAAKPVGMEVHAWKVMWQFSEGWLAPLGRSEPYKAAGRLQVDKNGKVHPWLCPCDERNRKEELAAIMELADYDLDGIHLDYIRYSSRDYSYSQMCRDRFEKERGKKVKHWPKDAAPGGKLETEYHEFRKGTITSFVRLVRKALKKKKPSLKLSAAVFNVPGIAENSVSQEWVKWGKEGLLDMINTMTYTEDSGRFAATIRAQKAALGNAPVLLVPGLQSTYDGGKSLSLADAVSQVLATRNIGAGGFVMFEWRDFLQDSFMPYFRAGLTREGPYQLKFRENPEADRVVKAVVGKALTSKGDVLNFDDFEDGDLFSLNRGVWMSEGDRGKLGTVVKPSPFKLEELGPAGSSYYARIYGHYGISKAPWPSAILQSPIFKGNAPADLREFSAIEFDVKGDGNTYELVLLRQSVKDYSYFRLGFPSTSQWKTVSLPLHKFEQPGWGKPVEKELVDVTHLRFQPAGSLSDVDFDLRIDNIRFVK